MALLGKTISYELQGELDGRLETKGVFQNKEEALNAAAILVGENNYHMVRIKKDVDGAESNIYEKSCEGPSEKPIKLSAIETAPLCKNTADLLTFEARKTGGRLLRQYLDDLGITFLELACSFSHMRSFQRRETLFNQALSRVGMIQAKRAPKSEPTSAADRVTILERLYAKNLTAIKDLGDVCQFVEVLETTGGTTLLAMLESSHSAQQDLIFWATTAAYLNTQRDWSEKINLIVNQIKLDSGDEVLSRLDSILAELLDGSEAVKEIIGSQSDLGSSLITVAKLSMGRLSVDKTKSLSPQLSRLNELLGKTKLPLTRSILLDRVAQGTRSIQPLTQQGEEANKASFVELLGSLVAPSGIIGGSAVCEAVTIRARTLFGKEGEDLPAEIGIGTIASKITVPATKFIYLFDLGKSDFGTKYRSDIMASIEKLADKYSANETPLSGSLNETQFSTLTNLLRQRFQDNFLDEENETRIILKIEALLSARPQTSTPATPKPAKQTVRAGVIPSDPQTPEEMLAAAQAATHGTTPELPQTVSEAATKHNSQKNPTKKIFPAGEIIFHSGDIEHEAYLVVSGEIEILAEKENRTTVLARLTKGDILGEMALVDQSPRMATAKAITDTELSVISEQAFRNRLDRLEQNDRVLRRLLDIYVTRLRAVTDMI